MDDQIVNRLMHKHNVKPSDEQVNYLGIYLSQDAEERIKKARLDRKKFYNDEAYKVES